MNDREANNPPCFALSLLSLDLHLVPKDSVLCLADGEGRNSAFLPTNKGVAVDAQVGDLTTFDMGKNNLHEVISIYAHLPECLRQDVHRCAIESLVPGGVFLLEAYTVAQIGRGTGAATPTLMGYWWVFQ